MCRSRAKALVLACAALALAACGERDPFAPRPIDGGEGVDAGAVQDAGGPLHRRDGGSARIDGGPSDAGPPILPPEVIIVEVSSMTPGVGPTMGGTPLVVTGRGFVAGTVVTVGGAPLVSPVITGERRISGTTPPGAAGIAAVLVRNDAGQKEVPGGFQYVEAPRLASATPNRGPLEGGTVVTLDGAGFTPGAAVLVGQRPALDVRVLSPSRISFVTPSGAAAGPTKVSVIVRAGIASQEGAFTYVDVPRAFTLRPVAGPLAGGNLATLVLPAHNLALGGARVLFGDRPSPSVTARTMTEIDAIVPGGAAAGPVDVTLVTSDGAVVGRGAYAYYPPGSSLVVSAVVPGAGPVAGGSDVRVVGAGFDSGVQDVTFGGVASSAIGLESANVLRVTTPPGALGPVDVVVRANGNRSATLAAGYRYEGPFAIGSIAPTSGPVEGGTLVSLQGLGFTEASSVFFGPVAASDVRFVDASSLVARSPSGSAGAVDVSVREGGRVARAPGAFTYYDSTRLYGVSPARGATAGGTFITLTGTGFGEGARVFVGGTPAVEVQFVDAFTVTARTPPGPVGRVDVVVVGPRGPALGSGAFEYFDPTVSGGGASGGNIGGSVNVTVLDATDSTPIAGAFATLAVVGASLYEGITNREGQVTFSGPGLAGRQVVTAGKDGYSATTVVSVDARDVTVYLTPLDASFGIGPGPELSTIRGVIRDAFKGIPAPPDGYRKTVLVTTTLVDRFTPNPNARGVILLLADDGTRDDRPFEIVSRPGDVAAYALAGHISTDGSIFIPFQLGVARHLAVPVGGVVENVLIEVGTALTARLVAPLVNAPPLRAEGPNRYRMRVFLELGSDGALQFFQLPESIGAAELVQEHLVPLESGAFGSARYTIVAGAYNVVEDQEYSPMVVYTKDNVRDLTQPVPLGPMMALAAPVSPADIDFLEGDRFAWSLATPPAPAFSMVYVLKPGGLGFVTIWQVIVPGPVRDVQLPDLALLAGLEGIPSGDVLYWAIISSEGPAFDVNDFRYDAFDQTRWKNYSIAPYVFLTR